MPELSSLNQRSRRCEKAEDKSADRIRLTNFDRDRNAVSLYIQAFQSNGTTAAVEVKKTSSSDSSPKAPKVEFETSGGLDARSLGLPGEGGVSSGM